MFTVLINLFILATSCFAGNTEDDYPEEEITSIPKILWSEIEEKDLLTEDEHKVAFRDVFMEQLTKRFFKVWLSTSKAAAQGKLVPNKGFPDFFILKDPITVGPPVNYSGKKEGVYDVTFQAHDCQVHGLHDLKLKSLDILRHMGLNDIRVIVQVVSTISLTGNYQLNGTGLATIPITGSGNISLIVEDLTLTGETYGLYRKYENKLDELFIRDMEIKVKNKALDVNMQNLMGGSALGDVANSMMDVIGEAMLYEHKDLMTNYVRKMFRKVVSTAFENYDSFMPENNKKETF